MAQAALAQITKTDVRSKTSIVPKVVTSASVAATVEAFEEVSVKISQLKGKQELLKAALLTLHKKHGTKFEAGEFLSVEVPGTHTSINRAKLVKLGVKASLIEAATDKTKYTYPRVTRKKKSADEADEEAFIGRLLEQ